MPRGMLSSLVAVLVTLGTAFTLLWWFGEGHGASLSRLATVRPGMTADQVRRILGSPGTVNLQAGASQSWHYTRWTWCQVKVHFDGHGRVSEMDHDH
jgi:outer membrane protein assembly factor BamE (lipoprotein component of BamABCDE complex)